MKKLIAFAVVLALIAGAAFAQLSESMKVSGSVEATWIPFRFGGPQYDFTETGKLKEPSYIYDATTGALTPVDGWSKGNIFSGWGGLGVKVSFSGSTDYAGFSIAIKNDKGTGKVDGGDFWVRPFGTDLLKFNFNRADGPGLDSKGINIYSNPPDLLGGSLKFGLTIPNGDKLRLSGDVRGTEDTADNRNKDDAYYRWVASNMWRAIEAGVGFKFAKVGNGSISVSGTYLGGWGGTVNMNSPSKGQWNDLLAPNGFGLVSTGAPYLGNVLDFTNLNTLTPGLTTNLGVLAKVVGVTSRTDLLTPTPTSFRKPAGGDFMYDSGDYTGARTNFKAAVSVSKVIKGLGIDLDTRLFMPMTAKASFINPGVPADSASAEVKSAGGVNLGLTVNYTLPVLDDKISVKIVAKADRLGRTTTYKASGVAGGVTFSREGKVTEPVKGELSLDASFKATDKITLGFNFKVNLAGETKVSYTNNVNDGTTAPVSETWTNKDSTIKYTAGLKLDTKISGISLGVGLDFVTPDIYTASWKVGDVENWGKGPKKEQRFYITVPVKVSYSF